MIAAPQIQRTPLQVRRLSLAVLCLLFVCLLSAGCAKEYHLTVTVNPDGTADVLTRFVMEREQAEQLVNWHQRSEMSRHMYYGDEQGWEDIVEEGVVISDEPQTVDVDAEPESLTDEQIIQGFTEVSREQSPLKDIEGVSQEMSNVTLDEKSLHAEGKAHFDSLELFVKHGGYYWERAGIESFRIEQDDEGNVSASATPGEMYLGDDRQVRRMLKSLKFKGSFRLNMPGAILTSPLPNTDTNTTWIEVEGEDDASLDRLFAVMDETLSITAQPGELDLSALPLDSTELAEPMQYDGPDEPDPFADLELVEGAEGYYAEATTLTTSTIILLPGAEEQLGHRLEYLRSDFNNAVSINATLFAPQGQKLLSVSDVKLEHAVDDLGEPIGLDPHDADGSYYRHVSRFYNDDEDPNTSANFNIELELPQPDAQAIEEIKGTLTVVAFDQWATHKVERVRANPDRRIDLSDILPGATLTVKRYKRHVESDPSNARIQGRFELELHGPKEISALQLEVELPGSDHVSSYPNLDETQTGDGVTTRSLMLEFNEWSRTQADPDAVTLTVRFPQGVRREQVPFTLEALDFY